MKSHAAAVKVGEARLGRAVVREVRAKADLPVWRRDAESGRAFSLILTKAGRTCAAESAEPAKAADAKKAAKAIEAQAPAPTTKVDSETSQAIPRSGSKLADVIALLRRDEGISVTELMALTR